MLTRFTQPEHIPVFRALLEIEIEIEIARERHDPHQSTDKARSIPVRPPKKITWQGDRIYIYTYTDIATTRPTRPREPSWWKVRYFLFKLRQYDDFFRQFLLALTVSRAGGMANTDLKKKIFVCSEIFGIQAWRKFKLRQNSVNQIFNPNVFFFFLLKGAIYMLYHAIYIFFFLNILHHFQAIKMMFFKLFLILTFKE